MNHSGMEEVSPEPKLRRKNHSVPTEAGVVAGLVIAIFLFVFPSVVFGKFTRPATWLQNLVSIFPETTEGKLMAAAGAGVAVGCLTWIAKTVGKRLD